MNRLVLCGVALALFARPSVALTQDKAPKEIYKEEGKLTSDDPRDKNFDKSYSKTHTVKLDADQLVRIDLRSNDFDSYLRLLDEAGKVLAEDDDSGGFPHARIIYKVEKAGLYKLVVTTYDPEKTGKYTLTIAAAGPRDVLTVRAQKLVGMDKKDKAAFVGDFKKYLAERGKAIEQQDVSLAAGIAMGLERIAPDLAADTYTDFGNLLAKSGDAKVAKFSNHLIGAGRRIGLPGKEMVVKGTTFDGKPFDWKSYRGKVVLVDFWATWCGPCRAELPNIRKQYEAYKDKGFEVVGISIDRDRKALATFLDREKLPWTCLHEKDAQEGDPMAEYYGIFSIPLAILVDRDGKVLSLHARGPELGRLLEKALTTEKK